MQAQRPDGPATATVAAVKESKEEQRLLDPHMHTRMHIANPPPQQQPAAATTKAAAAAASEPRRGPQLLLTDRAVCAPPSKLRAGLWWRSRARDRDRMGGAT